MSVATAVEQKTTGEADPKALELFKEFIDHLEHVGVRTEDEEREFTLDSQELGGLGFDWLTLPNTWGRSSSRPPTAAGD